MKRIISVVLTLTMMLALCSPAFAESTEKNVVSHEVEETVLPESLESVEEKIALAQSETVLQQDGYDFHYYWGDNYFVVQDHGGYYCVEIDENFEKFTVNGRDFEIINACRYNQSLREEAGVNVTYPTPWYTMFDLTRSFDVGNLPVSVVTGLVVGVLVGGMSSKTAGVVAGAVVGAIVSCVATGMFPADYYLTVEYLKRYRMIDDPDADVEYYERTGVYGGPSSNHYQKQFYYDTNDYVREFKD